MKAVKYELKIIFKKEIMIGSRNRKMIEKALRDMIVSGQAMDVSNEELFAVLAEEKGERDCPGNCDNCLYLCPNDGDCMMDDLADRCVECGYHCKMCGRCTLKEEGDCGQECIECGYCCPECSCCTHPIKEQQPGKHLFSEGK